MPRATRPRPRVRDHDHADSPPANRSRWRIAGQLYLVEAYSAAQFAALSVVDRSMLRCGRRADLVRVQADGSWHLLIAIAG
jgi:alpha-D-ribose 1-methylphosphonate 5-triphosphate diphosphatase PhnM